MKVIIIEDEALSAKHLTRLLTESGEAVVILTVLDSVKAAVRWLSENPNPDLIFMDIQLSDGLCFDIFELCPVASPVVFTTAYDEYAIRAFKVNSIDYLLKPISPVDLQASLKKFFKIAAPINDQPTVQELLKLVKQISEKQPAYRSRFLLKKGETFHKISSSEIAYFQLENKLTSLTLNSDKKFITDYTLDELEASLDPGQFFRINRQCIININAIESIHLFPGGSLKLKVRPPQQSSFLVSRRRVPLFKEWIEK